MLDNNTLKMIEKIKIEKSKQKLTNYQLSVMSGVPLGTLNKILSGGVKSVKVEVISKIENCLYKSTKLKTDNYGFIRVGAYSPKIKLANVVYNEEQIIQGIKEGIDKGVKILVFPELSLTGYTLGDLFYQDILLESSLKGLENIVNYTLEKNVLVFVGMPIKNGNKIYNVAVGIYNGEILGVIPKNKVNGYDENYIHRAFSDFNGENTTITIFNKEYIFGNKIIFSISNDEKIKISCEINNTLFKIDELGQNLAKQGSLISVNLACNNEIAGRKEQRQLSLKSKSKQQINAIVYANAGEGESTTDLIYSGHSLIVEDGEILCESKLYSQGLIYNDIDIDLLLYKRSKYFDNVEKDSSYKIISFNLINENIETCREYSKTPFIVEKEDFKLRAESILEMQAHALSRRINHIGSKTLILGVSGGLDSTLALLVCVRAIKLSNKNLKDIIGVTMPCFGTTNRTKSNAISLMEEFGITIKEINISNAVKVHFEDIEQDITKADVTFENSQARERTQVLMDLSNKYNGIVVGTGDLSELALGWCTYNGDHMSMYSVNGSIPKTLMRKIIEVEANNIGGKVKDILLDIIDTPVSPELLPKKEGEMVQKTEDIVGPYILHDFYLYYAVGYGFKPSKIFYIAKKVFSGEFDEKTLYKWLENFYRRFFNQQFKRSCLPDGVKVLDFTLSPRGDWRMPSDALNTIWKLDLENIQQSL